MVAILDQKAKDMVASELARLLCLSGLIKANSLTEQTREDTVDIICDVMNELTMFLGIDKDDVTEKASEIVRSFIAGEDDDEEDEDDPDDI